MWRSVKKAVDPILPAGIRRWLIAVRYSRHFRNVYFGRQIRMIFPFLAKTGETHNFTYDLTDTNLRYLAETIAVVTGRQATEIENYIQEAIGDRDLRAHFNNLMQRHSGAVTHPDVNSPFGRRLGWYAIARAIKPKVLVETGVERGHGALVLCAALLRNATEGSPGRYFGTDINPKAGWLLGGKYAATGKILYGDSITSLEALNETIDLFINDSDHSADYEAREYKIIASKLSSKAIILGDNAHVTDKLAIFSREQGRRFLLFSEKPQNHWYPGAGIGISF